MNLQKHSLTQLLIGILLIPFLGATISCSGKKGSRHKTSTDSTDIEMEGESVVESLDHPLDFKLYMERSGSMVSFDSEKSKGDFKGIISTLLNRFPKLTSNDSTYVYIVNDNIYPYEGTVKDFLSQRDFFSSTKDVGNPSYTDFNRIFEMILADTKKYQVSALVTDMIYSVNGQENVSASKLLNEAYALTHNIFKGKTSTSVIVLKFEADYNGPYYPYNSPTSGVHYNGERPFYVMLFASKDTMEELYGLKEYRNFINFSTLDSYENMFCFTTMQYKPQYSIITDYDHEGRYRKEREGKSKTVTGIVEAQLSKNGEISIPIAIDLSHIPLPNSYKKNKDYYEIESSTGFKIQSIQSIDEIENESCIRSVLPNATHLLLLNSDSKPMNESVKIKMLYKLPAWIAKSSSSDDSNLSDDNFSRTTFGFEEVMKGMYEAYVQDGNSHFLFDIDINIGKK